MMTYPSQKPDVFPSLTYLAEEQKQKLKHQIAFQQEIIRAIRCKTPKQKQKLVAEWNKTYCPEQVKTLLNVARDSRIANKIANWPIKSPD